MSRTSFVIIVAFICLVLIAHVQSRNLAMTGGVSSLFNSPFRVIGKRSQLYGYYRQGNLDFPQVPLAIDQFDY
ncbi:hypothetical protein RB195_016797 [Necator americanus]|uniref:Uncharacterized protein n=2 Tax=Necator americanus TaxID=51031 RepID=W2TA54_NECAM|nr:hypothetical protein NECAME_10593 [Necator americanus]ETN78086.1 hypothetical protein NECAME_10593 [Necator americanus]